MSIVDTIEEIQTFLKEEDTVALMIDEPTKFMLQLNNLVEDAATIAEDVLLAVETAIDAVEGVRARAEDVVDEVENAISELEYVK